MTKENIKERLKKVMELANRGVDGEMETAMRMANKILEENGWTRADVLVDEVEMPGKRWETWMSHLFSTVAENCGCFVVRRIRNSSSTRLLIGEEVNTIVAKELYSYLRDYVLRISNEHKMPRNERIRFKESITCGICKKLQENEMVWLEGSKKAKEAHDLWAEGKTLQTESHRINPNSVEGLQLGYEVNLAKQAAGVGVDKPLLSA